MRIRSAQPEDADRLLEIYRYYVEKTAVSFETETPSLREFRNRIEKTLEEFPYFVIEDEGEILGYAYAGRFHPRAAYSHCAELSIYLDEKRRGKGLGAMLYGALEEALRQMGYRNLYACIADPIEEDEYLSRASERFHSRLGFVKNGEFHQCGRKFGRLYNMIYMEKLIGTEN